MHRHCGGFQDMVRIGCAFAKRGGESGEQLDLSQYAELQFLSVVYADVSVADFAGASHLRWWRRTDYGFARFLRCFAAGFERQSHVHQTYAWLHQGSECEGRATGS